MGWAGRGTRARSALRAGTAAAQVCREPSPARSSQDKNTPAGDAPSTQTSRGSPSSSGLSLPRVLATHPGHRDLRGVLIEGAAVAGPARHLRAQAEGPGDSLGPGAALPLGCLPPAQADPEHGVKSAHGLHFSLGEPSKPSVSLLGPRSGEPAWPGFGEQAAGPGMVQTEDRSEGGCLQQEPSCPEGRGPSSCPARRVQTGAPEGPRRAPLCARPQGAVALPLNLVGSKFGLLAVTLAALLSSCVFIFPFEPLWRFRPSQKGLNQMSHGRPRPSSLPHALEAGGWGWAAGPTRVGVGKGVPGRSPLT